MLAQGVGLGLQARLCGLPGRLRPVLCPDGAVLVLSPSGAVLILPWGSRARRHWRKTGYYRLLARFLFFAARPEKRVNVFQRFYALREGLIERFYAARSNPMDKIRVLWGEPPVSIPSAIAAMFRSGAPLKTGEAIARSPGKADISQRPRTPTETEA